MPNFVSSTGRVLRELTCVPPGFLTYFFLRGGGWELVDALGFAWCLKQNLAIFPWDRPLSAYAKCFMGVAFFTS